MTTVSGTECVVYVNVGKSGKFFAKFKVTTFFACVETSVFKQHHFAVLHSGNLGLCVLADNVMSKRHFAVKQLVEAFCNGFEAELLCIALQCLCNHFGFCGIAFGFRKSIQSSLFLLVKLEVRRKNIVGLSEVRAKDYLCTVIHKIFDGRQCTVDTVFVGDYAVFHGYVEVYADKALLAFHVYISDSFLVHTKRSLLCLYFGVVVNEAIPPSKTNKLLPSFCELTPSNLSPMYIIHQFIK